MTELHQVVKAEAVDASKVRVSFENGVEGLFDCTSYMAEKYWENWEIPPFSTRCVRRGEHCAGLEKSTSTPRKSALPDGRRPPIRPPRLDAHLARRQRRPPGPPPSPPRRGRHLDGRLGLHHPRLRNPALSPGQRPWPCRHRSDVESNHGGMERAFHPLPRPLRFRPSGPEGATAPVRRLPSRVGGRPRPSRGR